MEGEGSSGSGTVMKGALALKKQRKSLSLPIRMTKDDPKKPKGKMSAYAFFVQTCRDEYKKKKPDTPVNFVEFSRRCSDKWKIMTSKEKSKFEEMAKVDKARYDREMKDYEAPAGNKKDPSIPKKPPSGFFLFCSKVRPKIKANYPGISVGAVAKKLGMMWAKLSEGEKQPYRVKAARLKEKYEREMADLKAKEKPGWTKGPRKATYKKARKVEDDEDDQDRNSQEDDEEDDDMGDEGDNYFDDDDNDDEDEDEDDQDEDEDDEDDEDDEEDKKDEDEDDDE
ncbi:high mobility group protein B3-like [Erinaceus europaeus]|uniref:High mobility group protein B3-like n=1 Tax=Erinaceus europaeus TaxID=9365 RepID=A0ABM3WQ75_ERIEU|nr:high mobility group protein B3-like [Erinaceus europaeus]